MVGFYGVQKHPDRCGKPGTMSWRGTGDICGGWKLFQPDVAQTALLVIEIDVPPSSLSGLWRNSSKPQCTVNGCIITSISLWNVAGGPWSPKGRTQYCQCFYGALKAILSLAWGESRPASTPLGGLRWKYFRPSQVGRSVYSNFTRGSCFSAVRMAGRCFGTQWIRR